MFYSSPDRIITARKAFGTEPTFLIATSRPMPVFSFLLYRRTNFAAGNQESGVRLVLNDTLTATHNAQPVLGEKFKLTFLRYSHALATRRAAARNVLACCCCLALMFPSTLFGGLMAPTLHLAPPLGRACAWIASKPQTALSKNGTPF